jgi:hypothetical protein
MRKSFGAVLAAASLLSLSVLASVPAGAAAAGTTCKTGSGSAVFSPALPKLGDTHKVKDVLKTTGKVGGCSGAVKSATLTGVSPKSTGSNCTTIATPTKTPTKVTLTVKWNKGAASTVAAQLKEITGQPVTTQTVTGTVTKGQFKGKKLAGKIKYTLPSGACTTKPLSKVTYTDVGALAIK